jgi:hypothetical protein
MTTYRMAKGAVICGYPVSTLHTERKRGNLVCLRIAGKLWVTERAIRDMERICAERNPQDSGLSAAQDGPPSGSSLMERKKSALDAAKMTAKALLKPSKPTLPPASGLTLISDNSQPSSSPRS